MKQLREMRERKKSLKEEKERIREMGGGEGEKD